MFRAIALLTTILAITPAVAEVVILKDGSFVEGEITVQTRRTVCVDTRFGLRTFARSTIDEIIKSIAEFEIDEVTDFADLSLPTRAFLNARADYDLASYERALSRLDTFRDHQQDQALGVKIDWLVIELNERLGRWETASRLLRGKIEQGAPDEKIRAKAHLDIFASNPRHDLRYIGEKHARNFIRSVQVRSRARESDSLRDRKIMRLALEEYCEQLLVEEELSVKAFADKLDPEATYKAITTTTGSGNLAKHLPYMGSLISAEVSLLKAQAILGEYGTAFELDLARAELNHLLTVSSRMLNEAVQLSPEGFRPAADQRTGRLTGEGRRAWRRACDLFLARADSLTRLYAYMVDKVNRYPNALRDLQRILVAQKTRFEEVVKAVKKAKGRTHV